VRAGTAVLAIPLVPAPLLRADDRDALLNRAVQAAEDQLQTCGEDLHARFGLEAGSLRAITYAVAPSLLACRDSNIVALGKVGEPVIVLCTPQFWRKVKQDEEAAAHFLIHEYLHTRGLDEWPHGGMHDSVSITRIVKESCSGIREPAVAFALRQALRKAEECRPAVRAAFKVEARTPAVRWRDADPEVCRARPAGIAYVDRDDRSVIRVCPAFARGTLRSRVVWVLHEELHTMGVPHPDRADGGHEMSERIAAACFRE
jgi:hypothetical protein